MLHHVLQYAQHRSRRQVPNFLQAIPGSIQLPIVQIERCRGSLKHLWPARMQNPALDLVALVSVIREERVHIVAQVFTNGDEFHFRRDDALAGVVHLRHATSRHGAQWCACEHRKILQATFFFSGSLAGAFSGTYPAIAGSFLLSKTGRKSGSLATALVWSALRVEKPVTRTLPTASK